MDSKAQIWTSHPGGPQQGFFLALEINCVSTSVLCWSHAVVGMWPGLLALSSVWAEFSFIFKPQHFRARRQVGGEIQQMTQKERLNKPSIENCAGSTEG